MIMTHQAFPLHDIPWDFWRFSDTSWHGIFNKFSGFEIIETSMHDPVSIVPKSMYSGTFETRNGAAFIHSAVIVKKVSDCQLSWDVNVANVLDTVYPE